MQRGRSSFTTAFTLLELILVLAVLAILVGIAVPALSAFGRGRRVTHAADQVVALARLARTQAITRGLNFRLNIDTRQRLYWVTVQNGASFESLEQPSQDGTQTTQFAEWSDDAGRKLTAPDGVTLESNLTEQPDGTYVQFRPTGRTDPVIVRFTDADGVTVAAGCLSATEDFHVLSDEERRQALTMTPPPPARSR